MTENKHIGIVTVTYNSATVLDEFFETLDQQTYKDFTLYVVDNASNDDSLAIAQRLAEKATFKCVFLPQSENLGVAAGNNIGIRAALADDCPFVLLSNNDIILQPETIKNLLEGMGVTRADLAVPKIYYANTDKIIWSAGGYFTKHSYTTRQGGQREVDRGQFEKVCDAGYAPTCFTLIKSEVFKKIGFMDELYFVYYDDSDFIWRATQKEGLVQKYIPNSIIWHKVSVSTGGGNSPFSIRYLHRNHVYFGLKHSCGLKKARFILYLFSRDILKTPFRFKFKELPLVYKARIEGLKLYLNSVK